MVRAGLTEKMRVEGTASMKDLGWKMPGTVKNQQGMAGVEGQSELLGEEEIEVTGQMRGGERGDRPDGVELRATART